MQNELTLTNSMARSETAPIFAVDTTFVLFFLAVEMGTTITRPDASMLFMAVTMAAFVALPHLLPFDGEKPAFLPWAAGRTMIATIALSFGIAFSYMVGTILPEGMRFLPMGLLIAAAAASAFVQMYVILRDRLAR